MYLSILQMENGETVSTSMRVLKTDTIRLVRLRLFKYDSPDGTLTVTLKDGSTTIGTASLTLAEINTDINATYFHGYVRFDFGDQGVRVNKKGTEAYREIDIEVALTGHTDDNSNYISLCRNFDTDFVDSYGAITNESDMTAEQLTHFQPFGIELYVI